MSPECGVGGAVSQHSDVAVGRDCRGEAFRGIICLQADELEGVNVGLEITRPGQRFEVFFYGHISTLKTNRWHMTSFYLLQHSHNTSFWHTIAIVRQKLNCQVFYNCYPSQSVCYRPQVSREGKWLRGGNADCPKGREKAFHWEWKPRRPHCCLIQNHWSCIWVSIIQKECCNPLWEGSRYWTLHYFSTGE